MQDTIIPQSIVATKNTRIGILATPATIAHGAYQKALQENDKDIVITEQPCPELAPAIETLYNHPESLRQLIKTYLHSMKQANVDTIILGCTHYALIKEIVRSECPGVTIISSDETISTLANSCITTSHTTLQEHVFITTGDFEPFQVKVQFLLQYFGMSKINYRVLKKPYVSFSGNTY